MTLLALLALLIAFAGFAYWAATLVLTLRTIYQVPILNQLPLVVPAAWPRLSVIVPACNERDSIEAALGALLANDYPNLEIIVINDRSTDDTGEIIDRVAERDPRIRAIHIQSLPEGWLGKVNALRRGVDIAEGQWLLFTDADVHLAPDTLRRAVAACIARDREHLALLPTFWSSTLLLDCAISTFLRIGLLASRAWAIESPHSTAAVGVGAFNLVRRDALARTPGLDWLRLEVLDDVGLAQMLKRFGVRISLANGRDALALHWYRSVPDMLRGTEKNAFAGLGHYSASRLLALTSVLLLLEWAPLVALVPGATQATIGLSLASIGCGICAILILCRWLGRSALAAMLAPVGAAIFIAGAWRSAILAFSRGGLLWRGTLYPTDKLRQARRFRMFG